MNENRKKWILYAALCVLAAALGYRMMTPQPRINLSQAPKKAMGTIFRDTPQETEDHSPVSRDQVSGKVHKNLFSLYRPEQPKVETPSEEIDPIDAFLKEDFDFGPADKTDARQTIMDDLRAYKIYGIYENQGQKAIFMGKKGMVRVVKPGDTLEKKYKIDQIREDAVVIRAMESNQTTDLSIREFSDE